MITEAVLGVLANLLEWVLDALPSITLPSWVSDMADTIADGLGSINAFAYFLPLNAIGNVVVFLVAVGLVIIAIRIARMVLSLLTGGGGSLA